MGIYFFANPMIIDKELILRSRLDNVEPRMSMLDRDGQLQHKYDEEILVEPIAETQ